MCNPAPEYARDLAYMQLAKLCESCGLRIEYKDLSETSYRARSDGVAIQMGMDTSFENSEHAAIVLGHELAHYLEDTFFITTEELMRYDIAADTSGDIEALCDSWGIALYKLALLLGSQQQGADLSESADG